MPTDTDGGSGGTGWGAFGARWPTASLPACLALALRVWVCDTRHAGRWAVEAEPTPLRRVLRCAACGRCRVEARAEGEAWLTEYAGGAEREGEG